MPCAFTDLEATNLDADEWAGDISNVTSVLKLWLRELPEPLFTMQLHQGFLDAASKHPAPTLFFFLLAQTAYGWCDRSVFEQKSTMTV
jgi:hypothetical protein